MGRGYTLEEGVGQKALSCTGAGALTVVFHGKFNLALLALLFLYSHWSCSLAAPPSDVISFLPLLCFYSGVIITELNCVP